MSAINGANQSVCFLKTPESVDQFIEESLDTVDSEAPLSFLPRYILNIISESGGHHRKLSR